MTHAHDGLTVTYTAARDADAPTLLFIHGFLDDATVWDGVIASLAGKVAAARYDLPGFGSRAKSIEDPRLVSLETLAGEAGQIVDRIVGPVIVVGQSLGTQVAELVAAEHADRVRGLVLLTPVPLGGTHLPDDAVAPFRALGGDTRAQRAVRAQLSPGLDAQQLDRFARIGRPVTPEVTARYADMWNEGVSDAPAVSAFDGPVLIIRGGADAFVTEKLLETISPRFADAHLRVIDNAGHWVHVEYPDAVASMILDLTETIASTTRAAGWRRGFSEKSQTAFADEFAEDVVLEASVLAKPIVGKALVAAALAAASSVYESLEFTAEVNDNSASYLQWRATAFGGVDITGVTVLQRDAAGKVVNAAIHHRPLTAVVEFSTELRHRLAGVIAADHFIERDCARETT